MNVVRPLTPQQSYQGNQKNVRRSFKSPSQIWVTESRDDDLDNGIAWTQEPTSKLSIEGRLMRDDESEADRGDNKLINSELVNCDRPMRFCMFLLGTLSGPSVVFQSRCLHILTTGYHIFMTLILTLGMISGFLFAWDEAGAGLDLLVRTLSALMLNIWIAVQTCAFLVISHLNSGLIRYYQHLVVVEERLTHLNVTISIRRIRVFVKVMVVILVLITLSNSAMRVNDYSDPDYDDALLGNITKSRVSSTQYLLIQSVTKAAFVVVGFHWAVSQTYFATICFVLWTLLADFNNKLRHDVASSPRNVLNNLEEYRTVHLDLCALVEQVDTLFRFKFGVLIGGNTMILLGILYLASVAVTNPGELEFGRFFYYVVITAAAIAVLIFFCHHVYSKTTDGYKVIQRAMEDEMSVTNLQLYQMQLFLDRIQKPEPLTAGGLLPINKELGMTLVGVVASYYIVMVQFNSLPSNPDSGSCDCAVSNITG